jgi:hypothetical protein
MTSALQRATGIADEKAAKRYLWARFRQRPLPEIQIRRGARFYVSAALDGRFALLLGPYVSHMTALANVDRGRRLALASGDRRAPFSAYGTISLPTTRPTVFGR